MKSTSSEDRVNSHTRAGIDTPDILLTPSTVPYPVNPMTIASVEVTAVTFSWLNTNGPTSGISPVISIISARIQKLKTFSHIFL